LLANCVDNLARSCWCGLSILEPTSFCIIVKRQPPIITTNPGGIIVAILGTQLKAAAQSIAQSHAAKLLLLLKAALMHQLHTAC
jgi:hypothetical protein